MSYTTAGLKNGGRTEHYQFEYDEVLGQAGATKTNALMDASENDYKIMSAWFGGIDLDLPLHVPVTVQVSSMSGGDYGSASWDSSYIVTLNNRKGVENNMVAQVDNLRDMMIAEVTEIFMKLQDEGWFSRDGGNEQSSGEGLSVFLVQQFQILNNRDPYTPFNGNKWLNSYLPKNMEGSTRVSGDYDYGERYDYVNNVLSKDSSHSPASGCTILFIYYLYVQLGFPIYRIVCAAAPTPAGVYKNLTKDDTDPFPEFYNILLDRFPCLRPFTVIIPDGDNPFPLPTNRILSTRKFAASLPIDQNNISVRSLMNQAGMPTLRPALNTKRKIALL